MAKTNKDDDRKPYQKPVIVRVPVYLVKTLLKLLALPMLIARDIARLKTTSPGRPRKNQDGKR
jgi:hypothetical protein